MSATPQQSLPAILLETLSNILGDLLDTTADLISRNAANVFTGVLVFVVGWIVATVLRGLSAKLARATGIDVISDRTGLRAYLHRNDIPVPLSRILGWLVYTLVLYATLIAAFDRAGLEMASDFLRHVAAWIPKLFVVFVLLTLGVALGRVARGLTIRAAKIGGLPVPEILGGLCRAAVLFLAVFLSLHHLEWASREVLTSGFLIVIGMAFLLAILLSVAARGLTESLLTHPFLKSTYKPGDRIRFDDVEGVVRKIDAAATHLECEGGVRIVPNRDLAAREVMRMRS